MRSSQSSAAESALRTVVIIFLNPPNDESARVIEGLVLVDRNLRFFQTEVEALGVAFVFGVVGRDTAMLDAEAVQGFNIARRRELGSVASDQSAPKVTRTSSLRGGAASKSQLDARAGKQGECSLFKAFTAQSQARGRAMNELGRESRRCFNAYIMERIEWQESFK